MDGTVLYKKALSLYEDLWSKQMMKVRHLRQIEDGYIDLKKRIQPENYRSWHL